jgi:hypothetical protein
MREVIVHHATLLAIVFGGGPGAAPGGAGARDAPTRRPEPAMRHAVIHHATALAVVPGGVAVGRPEVRVGAPR